MHALLCFASLHCLKMSWLKCTECICYIFLAINCLHWLRCIHVMIGRYVREICQLFIYLFIYLLIYLFIYLFIYSFIHSNWCPFSASILSRNCFVLNCKLLHFLYLTWYVLERKNICNSNELRFCGYVNSLCHTISFPVNGVVSS